MVLSYLLDRKFASSKDGQFEPARSGKNSGQTVSSSFWKPFRNAKPITIWRFALRPIRLSLRPPRSYVGRCLRASSPAISDWKISRTGLKPGSWQALLAPWLRPSPPSARIGKRYSSGPNVPCPWITATPMPQHLYVLAGDPTREMESAKDLRSISRIDFAHHPWEEFEIRTDGDVHTCCSAWLPVADRKHPDVRARTRSGIHRPPRKSAARS